MGLCDGYVEVKERTACLDGSVDWAALLRVRKARTRADDVLS
jgi:hypothetical protein